MTVQIPLLAFAFLGEPLGLGQIGALGLALAGILVVQLTPTGWPTRSSGGIGRNAA